MIFKVLLPSFLLASLVNGQTPPVSQERCLPNSSFTTCSSMCEPKCGAQIDVMCIEMCGPAKCQCDVGFLRDTNGQCVAPKDCSTGQVPPSKCPPNSTFTTCSSMCEPKCGETDSGVCIDMCGPAKCQCDRGFFRDPSGRCVRSVDCNSAPGEGNCAANSTYTDCASHCPPTCGKPQPEACILSCAPPKCECNPGYLLNSTGGCVLMDDCDQGSNQGNCSTNERWNECGGMCEPKCGQKEPMMCPAICMTEGACVCKEGFYRNKNGQCVSKRQCGLDQAIGTCPKNEHWNGCGRVCEPQCGQTEQMMCPAVCMIEGACVCEKGFYRSKNGECLTNAQCQGQDDEPKCTAKCSAGQKCVLQEVQCIQAPCPPIPTCVNDTAPPCLKECPAHQKCVLQDAVCMKAPCDPVPTCVGGPDVPVLTCATVDCITGHTCINTEKGPRCVPNNETINDPKCTAKCSAGQKCVLQEVQCIQAPCPPIPTCVDDPAGPCLAKCSAGQKCVWKDVVCAKAPCNPVPTCVDDIDVPVLTCATVLCIATHTCIDTEKGPRCVPIDDNNGPTGCAAVSCMVGQECVVDEKGNGRCQVNGNNGNCSRNEFWNPCTGCEATCADQGPVACTKDCRQPGACRCSEGFFRDMSGQCVTRAECDSQSPPTLSCANVLCMPNTTCVETPTGPQCVSADNNGTCSRNEFWNGCGGCEANCGDDDGPVICNRMCGPGRCRCNEGFFRDQKTGKCVTKRQCSDGPRITCANVRCAGPCIDTPTGPQCQSDDPLPACNLSCEEDFECVLAQPPCGPGEACPKTPTCIPNNATSCKMARCTAETECVMVQVQCFAPPCYPLPQCVPRQNNPQPGNPCDVMRCRPGYTCITETVNCVKAPCPGQGTHGRCVATQPEYTCANVDCMPGFFCQMSLEDCLGEECEAKPRCLPLNSTTACDENEVYVDCVPNCEETCHGVQSCKSSEMMAAVCQPGCTCSGRHRRNGKGKCVRSNRCYLNPGCGDNEEWNKCIGCEQKCGQQVDQASCSLDCRSGCACVEGFARGSSNQTCIPEKEC